MKLAMLLLAATAVICSANERAAAEDTNNGRAAAEDTHDAKGVVPKTEQKNTSAPTQPTGPENSIPVGGELDQGTRARTREDVIRDTLRDRRAK